MPQWLQIILHLLAVGAGAYASVATGTPVPAVIAGGISAAIGTVAQNFNTDGTPQSVAFVKTSSSVTPQNGQGSSSN